MDTTTFLDDLFEHYGDDRPVDTVLERAVRKAENIIGVKITDISETDDERRDWFENRVERFAVDSMLSRKTEDFDYSKAKLSQTFKNLSEFRDKLDEDWNKDMRRKVAISRCGTAGAGMVIPPGFSYDRVGRARRRSSWM